MVLRRGERRGEGVLFGILTLFRSWSEGEVLRSVLRVLCSGLLGSVVSDCAETALIGVEF